MDTLLTPEGRQGELSDEGLVLACRRGEAAAWSALVHRYERLIYTIPRRSGLDEDQAAEVFQRTFVKLLEHLHHVEQPERIRAWLVTTARRESMRLIRQQQLQQPIATLETFPDDDDAILPGEALQRLEEQHLVQMALATVDERCRRLITLLFYRPDPLPYAQIAVALGMSEASLSPTRTRCLQKLRRALKSLGF
jgi:RNA polymerase sigma factor (sigma-70 family)